MSTQWEQVCYVCIHLLSCTIKRRSHGSSKFASACSQLPSWRLSKRFSCCRFAKPLLWELITGHRAASQQQKQHEYRWSCTISVVCGSEPSVTKCSLQALLALDMCDIADGEHCHVASLLAPWLVLQNLLRCASVGTLFAPSRGDVGRKAYHQSLEKGFYAARFGNPQPPQDMR